MLVNGSQSHAIHKMMEVHEVRLSRPSGKLLAYSYNKESKQFLVYTVGKKGQLSMIDIMRDNKPMKTFFENLAKLK
jgi:hypothetical protein